MLKIDDQYRGLSIKKERNSSSWETNWSRGVQGLTRVPPSSRIPTLATAVANFKFPSADQNEHETVQLVLYREAREVEKYVWPENNRGLTKEGL